MAFIAFDNCVHKRFGERLHNIRHLAFGQWHVAQGRASPPDDMLGPLPGCPAQLTAAGCSHPLGSFDRNVWQEPQWLVFRN